MCLNNWGEPANQIYSNAKHNLLTEHFLKKIRMHSSRMRTARSLTVCCSHSICRGGACVSCMPPLPCMPPSPAMHPPTMHKPPAMHAPLATHTPLAMHAPHACPPPPCGQNHRCLWKYNLAPTSLRAVIIGGQSFLWCHSYPGYIFSLHASSPACNGFLRFTSRRNTR